MKKVLRIVVLLLTAMCISWGSVVVIFAKNSIIYSTDIVVDEKMSVNPYMAILAAVIAGIVGIIVLVKRNRENK